MKKIDDLLFSGKPQVFGGLSNELELEEVCPSEFREENSWSDYASKIFFMGADISKWKWRETDPEERKKKLQCFDGLLGSFGISHEGKEAVAGWMLSVMLEEVPEWISAKKE